MSPTTRRRILLASLVAPCALAVVLNGCATPDLVCDMKADYSAETLAAMQGKVLIRWEYNQGALLPPNVNGTTQCFPGDPKFCLIRMRGNPASFHDVCGMAKEVHELHHAFGANHKD